METIPRVVYNIVAGHVTDGNGRPLADFTVEIYIVNMREWSPLGNTFTGGNSDYLIKWQYPKIRPNLGVLADDYDGINAFLDPQCRAAQMNYHLIRNTVNSAGIWYLANYISF